MHLMDKAWTSVMRCGNTALKTASPNLLPYPVSLFWNLVSIFTYFFFNGLYTWV